MFFIVRLLAAIFDFTGIALAAAGVKSISHLFLVLFLLSLIGGLVRRTSSSSGFTQPRVLC